MGQTADAGGTNVQHDRDAAAQSHGDQLVARSADLEVGEYLRAMITADAEMERSDKYGFREALMRSFRNCTPTVFCVGRSIHRLMRR